MLQTAEVVLSRVTREKWCGGKMLDQEIENTTVFVCGDLMEAAAWADEHSKNLASGEHYDIYYRCECI